MNIKTFMNTETHYIEYPTLIKQDKNGKERIWKIFIRLIKKHSKKQFEYIDWNMMDEIQVPILNKYYDSINIPDDIQAEFWTETGIKGGKITRSIPTYPEEKNIGKKNFRNNFRQAITMCNSKWEKKINEGFQPLISNHLQQHDRQESIDQKVFPMLAKNLKDIKKPIKFPVAVQPKLDGLRMLRNKWHMYSRTKKEFPSNVFNDKIRTMTEKLLTNFPPNTYFDGELYNHNTKIQKLNHFVRQENLVPENKEDNLQYHIYDVFRTDSKGNIIVETFEERIKYLEKLENLISELYNNNTIFVVYTKIINNNIQLDHTYKSFLNNGYEGMMIRDLNGVYAGNPISTTGTRSNALIKRKEVFTAEYPIVNYTSGTKGKDAKAVIWICETENEQQFKVTPNLTYDERYQIYKECKKNFVKLYKNRLLTVEYRAMSIDNVPQHAKGLYIRDIE